MTKKVLVTGGAGYIGSVCTKRLLDKNYEVVVVDNLSKGVRELVDKRAKFYHGDLTDNVFLEKVFSENNFDSIIHFGAYKSVGESMKDGIKYSNNIVGSINLLNNMVKNKVKRIIFSSTAAVYGNMSGIITEETKTEPINYYGQTKLHIESIIQWYNKIYGIEYLIFRYFNVAGDELSYIDPNAENVFPIILEVIKGKRKEFTIFGNDYETKDGTCVRDYIDVRDLVNAHILGLENKYSGIINLGTEKGFSVKELVEEFKNISKINFQVKIGERRSGDPALLIASNKKAKEILSWQPEYTIKDMIASTIAAYNQNEK